VSHFVTPPQHFTYSGHKDYTTGVAWSPDGRQIASASGDGTVQIWEAETGKLIRTYRGHHALFSRWPGHIKAGIWFLGAMMMRLCRYGRQQQAIHVLFLRAERRDPEPELVAG